MKFKIAIAAAMLIIASVGVVGAGTVDLSGGDKAAEATTTEKASPPACTGTDNPILIDGAAACQIVDAGSMSCKKTPTSILVRVDGAPICKDNAEKIEGAVAVRTDSPAPADKEMASAGSAAGMFFEGATPKCPEGTELVKLDGTNMCKGPDQVFCEKDALLELVPASFRAKATWDKDGCRWNFRVFN